MAAPPGSLFPAYPYELLHPSPLAVGYPKSRWFQDGSIDPLTLSLLDGSDQMRIYPSLSPQNSLATVTLRLPRPGQYDQYEPGWIVDQCQTMLDFILTRTGDPPPQPIPCNIGFHGPRTDIWTWDSEAKLVLRDGRHMLLFQFRFPTSPFRGRLVADSVTKRVQLMTVSE